MLVRLSVICLVLGAVFGQSARPGSTLSPFSAWRVERQIGKALKQAKKVLDTTRNPLMAKDVDHKYTDKFLLAEFLTKANIAAQIKTLEELGLSLQRRQRLSKQHGKAVTLRFSALRKCVFDHNETKQVVTSDKVTLTTEGGQETKKTKQIIESVDEFYWKVDVSWKLEIFTGNYLDEDSIKITLRNRDASFLMKTASKLAPYSVRYLFPVAEASVTWLLDHTNPVGVPVFKIDRKKPSCRTPRRNEDITESIAHAKELAEWSSNVWATFGDKISSLQSGKNRPSDQFSPDVFIPTLPLFEKSDCQKNAEQQTSPPTSSEKKINAATDSINKCSDDVVLSPADMNRFVSVYVQTLKKSLNETQANYSDPAKKDTVLSSSEMKCIFIVHSMFKLLQSYSDSVEYIENMLKNQLIKAIGREVQPAEFSDYMQYHNRRMFKPEYAPKDFAYAVRRGTNFPDGEIIIEVGGFPISTIVTESDGTDNLMNFTVAGGTSVSFGGKRYLHSAMFHHFSNSVNSQMTIIARARQFSSFIIMIGTIHSANQFAPTHGLIVKDKDMFVLPLILETLPTAKAFREAIESLSAEQQSFAKAFRNMQLTSTTFGVCVVQIKPHMEKVLNLPPNALVKEIKLTQDLMELFIDYQIPTDLMSYDGDASASDAYKIANVKKHVEKLMQLLPEEEAAPTPPPTPPPTIAYSYVPQATHTTQASFRTPVARSVPKSVPVSPPVAHSASVPVSVPVPVPVPVDVPRPPPAPWAPSSSSYVVDYTQLPVLLDQQLEKLDKENAVSATTIIPTNTAQLFQTPLKPRKAGSKNTISSSSNQMPGSSVLLQSKDLETATYAAFDLIDALTKSGGIVLDEVSLHVIIASTHKFDKTLTDTIVQDNKNPIDSVERSTLIIASTITNKPVAELIVEGEKQRIQDHSSNLF